MATAHAVVVKRLPADPKDVALVKPAWGTEDILAFLDSLTAPLPDNLRPPAGLTTKQSAERLGNEHRTRRSSYGLRELPIIKANSRGR
jgi:hypothetical protein